ncbi:MAG: putative basic amino acid antiporter YfcC [Ignavibacteriota bacterium]|nr:putative basic amino acid antiporter YfcC [Ignavibacteriota bacterium]MCO6447718.1 YfcC family protein [Ignavibacterium album]MCZ2267903.1 YfcC family protein [Ignavibacteriales bacterium]HMN16739.1 YfcC family protein [Ignavibacteriaceae bacterium]QKK00128.1 MAG: putative basic amino acid antiporter YfcC [Ignavibacteriota bacterium]
MTESKKRFKIKVPNTYLLIFSLLVLIAILTWIIPGGQYERAVVNGREVVVQNSFKYVDNNPQGFLALFIAPLKGFVEAGLIIGFILFVGGAFNVLAKTDAINSLISKLARAHKDSKLLQKLFIPVIMLMFSIGGATFGMNEEIIPFVLIIVPICLALGYDSIIGVAIPLVGAHVGFASAFLNPFNVGIAQGIADVPLFSGIGYRFISWAVSTTVAILFLLWYVNKLSQNPKISPTYEMDEQRRKGEHFDTIYNNNNHFSTRHKAVLTAFALCLILIVIGVIELGWYIEEISAAFFIMGVVVGIIGGLKVDEFTKAFIDGAKDLVGTALIVALARATLVISRDGQIIDTILYGLSPFIESSSPIFASQKMFVVQAIINFFVHSGSGQAALTMPIMAPLSDLAGVSRQTAILAFQFGEYTNIIIPTSAVTMGALSMAKVPWEKWAKWALPLMVILFILGFILLIPPNLIGWQ